MAGSSHRVTLIGTVLAASGDVGPLIFGNPSRAFNCESESRRMGDRLLTSGLDLDSTPEEDEYTEIRHAFSLATERLHPLLERYPFGGAIRILKCSCS